MLEKELEETRSIVLVMLNQRDDNATSVILTFSIETCMVTFDDGKHKGRAGVAHDVISCPGVMVSVMVAFDRCTFEFSIVIIDRPPSNCEMFIEFT